MLAAPSAAAPAAAPAHDTGEHLDSRGVRVRRRHGVIRDDEILPLADTAERHEALAVLRRLDGVGLIEDAGRARNLTERLGDHLQRLGFIEPTRDRDDGVIRLVELLVELGEPVDRHPFDVFLRPDRRLAVVVPEVCGRGDALAEDRRRIVLAALELVAHDRHLGVEQLLGELYVHHTVGFQAERPVQVVVRRRDCLVVVRAVVVRRPVPTRCVRRDLVLDLSAVRRLDEVHVLEQVRHPRFAVSLVA